MLRRAAADLPRSRPVGPVKEVAENLMKLP
jgi:hypothetical protein